MPTLPWNARPDLTEERLSVIAEGLLNIRHDTFAEMVSRFDDNYTRGCATFGRQRQWLLQLALSGRYSWLTLASSAMDLTVQIGFSPVRFFTDDHDSPKKQGYFRRNEADCLFSSDETEPVMFRFVVEPAAIEDDEDRVFFLGYNVHQEVVVEWQYKPKTSVIAPVGIEVPAAVVQSEPTIGLKQSENEQTSEASDNR